MKAKIVYESLNDIFVPKSEQQIKDDWWKYLFHYDPDIKISRLSKDNNDVVLLSKTFYSEADADFYNDYYLSYAITSYLQPNKWIVSGMIFIGTKIGWKPAEWNEDGSLTFSYNWITPSMKIDPLTKYELEMLPVEDAK